MQQREDPDAAFELSKQRTNGKSLHVLLLQLAEVWQRVRGRETESFLSSYLLEDGTCAAFHT